MISNFTMFTKVVYGLGSLNELPEELKKLKTKRPLVVAGPSIVASGLLAKLEDVLKGTSLEYTVYSGVTPTAKVEVADEAWARGREFRADSVVGIGGGSTLVIAKAAAVLGGGEKAGENPTTISDYAFKPPVNVLPIICIPTTAGSGAEVSPSTPMVDVKQNRKIVVKSDKTYPNLALLDATLMKDIPPVVEAQSGIDALTHAIESCLTNRTTRVTKPIAYGAMSMLMDNLRKACYTADLEAKQICLEASFMSNMACKNTLLGYVHGCARNVQTLFTVPYGMTIGVFLVPVMQYNLGAAPDRLAEMAPYLGVTNCEKYDTIQLAKAAIQKVKELIVDLRLPRKFTPEQVDSSKIPLMAKMVFVRDEAIPYSPDEIIAMEFKGFAPNPNIRRATVDDLIKIYTKAMEGWELDDEPLSF